MTRLTLLTRKTLLTFLLAAALSSYTRVAGAGTKQGTCACRNPGWDSAGTTQMCWKTPGTPQTGTGSCEAVTMIASGTQTTCEAASLHLKDTTADCKWSPRGLCTKRAGGAKTEEQCAVKTPDGENDCDTFGNSGVDCEWATGTCEAKDAADNATCRAITGDMDGQDGGADSVRCAAVASDKCVWVTHLCGCTVSGKAGPAKTPRCYAAAAKTSAFCPDLLEGTADGKCEDPGDEFDHCTWVNYNASKVPVTDTAGTCACVNPGYDTAGTTEKCWKTLGTVQTACDVAVDTAACTAASVNTGDCFWTANTSASCKLKAGETQTAGSSCAGITSTPALCEAHDGTKCFWHYGCGCKASGKNSAAVDTCYAASADAKAATFCSGAIGATATTKTDCALAANADHCKWLIAESACTATGSATPTPCPESSASAPGALLALLAGLLAYLRC